MKRRHDFVLAAVEFVAAEGHVLKQVEQSDCRRVLIYGTGLYEYFYCNKRYPVVFRSEYGKSVLQLVRLHFRWNRTAVNVGKG